MKKSNVTLEELSVNAADPNLADNKVTVENNDIPSPKENSGSVPPPDYTLEELLANVPEPDLSTENQVAADNDVPPPKKEGEPLPPPDYTLEELLANVPEPNCKTLASSSSEEVDTGKPVGKEVW